MGLAELCSASRAARSFAAASRATARSTLVGPSWLLQSGNAMRVTAFTRLLPQL
jgi:hypothetical protein